ncbi:uncharacterized protein IWZ02DRAFT_437956 [Phyllosticta citriasiana]|uniref:uncharacterized protein n=1 Tax=Phyllosticta citriasiana TaxID=595635 RepID=UPI0030FDBF9F
MAAIFAPLPQYEEMLHAPAYHMAKSNPLRGPSARHPGKPSRSSPEPVPSAPPPPHHRSVVHVFPLTPFRSTPGRAVQASPTHTYLNLSFLPGALLAREGVDAVSRSSATLTSFWETVPPAAGLIYQSHPKSNHQSQAPGHARDPYHQPCTNPLAPLNLPPIGTNPLRREP